MVDEMNSPPKRLQPCLAVDVFLPKNLTNFPVLLSVLKDVLAFRPALRYLYRHAADIHKKYEPEFHLGVPDFHPVSTPRPMPKSLEGFKHRLRKVKKRIYGYSIFEVDGAFDQVSKSSVIGAGRLQHHRVAKPHVADAYFADRSAAFAKELASRLPKLGIRHADSSLHPHPLYAESLHRRLFVHGDDRFDVERTETEFVARRCLTISEERVLMIRFLTVPTDTERKRWSAEGFSVWTQNLNAAVARLLWDTMIVIGGFMAYRLGVDAGLEDQIWITYDVRALWIWKRGEPMLGRGEGAV